METVPTSPGAAPLQMSPVKSNNKETNVNNESDIIIESPQDTIHIPKKELVNKENSINNLSIILKKITSNTYNVSLRIKNLAMN